MFIIESNTWEYVKEEYYIQNGRGREVGIRDGIQEGIMFLLKEIRKNTLVA